jgi:hypothetical protein
MKEQDLPTAEDIFIAADQELSKAYRALGDAADWLRSDWQPLGSALSNEQTRRRSAIWKAIDIAKSAINEAR